MEGRDGECEEEETKEERVIGNERKVETKKRNKTHLGEALTVLAVTATCVVNEEEEEEEEEEAGSAPYGSSSSMVVEVTGKPPYGFSSNCCCCSFWYWLREGEEIECRKGCSCCCSSCC